MYQEENTVSFNILNNRLSPNYKKMPSINYSLLIKNLINRNHSLTDFNFDSFFFFFTLLCNRDTLGVNLESEDKCLGVFHVHFVEKKN